MGRLASTKFETKLVVPTVFITLSSLTYAKMISTKKFETKLVDLTVSITPAEPDGKLFTYEIWGENDDTEKAVPIYNLTSVQDKVVAAQSLFCVLTNVHHKRKVPDVLIVGSTRMHFWKKWWMEDWSEIFSQTFPSHFLHQILRSSRSDVELLQKTILRN